MAVDIRAVDASDVPFLRAMLVEAAYPLDPVKPSVGEALAYPPTAAYLEGWGRSGDAGLVALDATSGERVGAAWYRLFPPDRPGYGTVDPATPELTIAIAAGRRGEGVGTALLRELLEHARDEGFAALSLSVGPSNPALRLYQRHGFARTASRDDHWTMTVRLESGVGPACFRYDAAIVLRFPTVVGGAVLARGVVNGPSPPALAAAFADEQRRVRERIGDRPLAELPSLAAWRRAFSAFGVEPTKYRSAAEALLRRLTKHGDVPGINLLVDLGNLVSIRYGLPVAVFDQRPVTGGTTVRLAEGGERFTDLGADVETHPDPGEVVFVDEAGLVSARRWCWRQSAQSAAREDTSEVLVTVEGHHEGGADDVAAAVADLRVLLGEHARAEELDHALLDARRPSFRPGDRASSPETGPARSD